jgi:hypothetical protein
VADEPESLVLEYLRRFDVQLKGFDAKLDRLGDDVRDMSVRLAHVEENLAGVHRRLDRLDMRVDRIERRLELIDAPHGGVRE